MLIIINSYSSIFEILVPQKKFSSAFFSTPENLQFHIKIKITEQ